ncbi:MAG TPA: lantibiotic dehydratase [Kofleriaceae bacterium]|nr:lantibiotic dehydratase [Kofleriaceae bacterium]
MSARRFESGGVCAVRVPLLPVDAVTCAGATGDARAETIAAQRAWLAALLARADVREALLVASPALHRELDVWRTQPDSAHGRKIEHALVKYVTRMATRATPYGLCAGIAAGRIHGRGVELRVTGGAGRRRRTRVDNEVLFRLAGVLSQTTEARERLTWSPNTSLVRVAGRWRYAEARAGEKDALRYHLVAIEPTPYLDATIERARGGTRLASLAGALVATEVVELDEARAYVDELAATQVLVPALGVTVTGAEPIDGMIAQLTHAGLAAEARALAEIRKQLAILDVDGGGAAAYDAIATAIEAMFTAAGASGKIERARLFQVDASAPVAARIGRDVTAEIERAVEALRRMIARREDPRLVALRRAFRERWEDREVPLAEVLDEEAGVGFAAASGPGSEGSPLLAGLPFAATPAEATTSWGAREQWLLGRLTSVWSSGRDELVLDERDLKELAAPQAVEIPPAWSVLVRLGGDPDAPSVLVDGASGPSGARLLGRFCHLDPAIEDLVRAHVAREADAYPGAVLAEVAHLADGRTGNILCRPVLRAHEIVYLGRSGAPDDALLAIDDLLVSVRGDRIVLRSRRLGCEVVPRLTSAHNVAAHGLGVYRFLAALQAQDGGGVGWSWGAFADAPRLPRVRIGRAVVARACWRFDGDELDTLATAARSGVAATFAAMQLLRWRRCLPRYVAVADGDNELWVDLDHALQVDAMVAMIAGRKRATLTEVWPAPADTVARGTDGAYASEVVVAFNARVTETSRVAGRAPAAFDSTTVERRFAPGSRWLYAKLYGGVSSADRVLRDVIGPVAREALTSGAARRWFFLRYADPHSHVRVRFDGDPARLLSETLPALHVAAAPLLADGALWRIQLDTYEREVERYGGAAGIEGCEDIFWHDAEASLAIVEQLDGDAGAEARWQLALVSCERLLTALGLDAAARERVFAAGKASLADEHRATAPLLKAVGERWRTHEARLAELLAPGASDPVLAPLDRRDQALRALRGTQRAPIIDTMTGGVARSLVHMSCNRLLHASPRAQELVIYEMLRRWHGRQRARAATTAAVPEVAA